MNRNTDSKTAQLRIGAAWREYELAAADCASAMAASDANPDDEALEDAWAMAAQWKYYAFEALAYELADACSLSVEDARRAIIDFGDGIVSAVERLAA